MARQRMRLMRAIVKAKRWGVHRFTATPVIEALVRGGTEHRIDLLMGNGRVMHLYRDGRYRLADIDWHADGGRWERVQQALSEYQKIPGLAIMNKRVLIQHLATVVR